MGEEILGVAALARTIRDRLFVVVSAVLPVVLGLFLASLVEATAQSVPQPVRLLGMLVGLGQGLALYRRRSNPRTVMAITTVGGLVVQLINPQALFPYAGLVAMWSLTTLQPPRISLPPLGALLAITALSWPTAPAGDTEFALATDVVVWALAEATRSRRAAIAQASRQAAEQEQARLARELHDVIAHTVSVIVVQAAAGDDVFDHNPAAAREALRSIEAAGRESLAELRRLLAAIGPVEPAEARHPQPELARIEELAEPLRALGLDVDLRRVDDDAVTIPAGVQLSTYRIVQEALTNVVRHAHATRVEVTIATTGNQLEITVTDNGAGAAQPGTGLGRGLAGMRERAAMLGGTLDAGPHPGCAGFRVRAGLPLQPPG